MKNSFSKKIVRMINTNFIIYSISLILAVYLVSYYIINVYITDNLDTIFDVKKMYIKTLQENMNSEFLMYKKYGTKNFKFIDAIYANNKYEVHDIYSNKVPKDSLVNDGGMQYLYFDYNYKVPYKIGINLNKLVYLLNEKDKTSDFIVVLKTKYGFITPKSILFNDIITQKLNKNIKVLKTKKERYNVKSSNEYGIEYYVLINSKIIDIYTVNIVIAIIVFLFIAIIINKTNSIFIQKNIETPINTIIKGIKGIKSKKLDKIIYEENDEFKLLSNEFNILYEQLKLTINELKQSEQNLKRASDFKSTVLKTLSHEIKTPLHSILGFTEYLKLKIQDEKDIEIINTIRKSSNDLLRKFEKLFERSKIETEPENIKLHFDPYNFKTTILRVAAHYETECMKKKLIFKLNFNIKKINTNFIDKSKLVRVLNELLDNALKFTEKGEIIFSVRNDDDYLYLTIEDTGRGIKTNEIEVIFEDFFQSEHFLTRTTDGMGMGLSISNFYVKVMDGSINFKSKKEGTIVTLKLPLRLTPKKIKNLSLEQDFEKLTLSKKEVLNINIELEKRLRDVLDSKKYHIKDLRLYASKNKLNTLNMILTDLENDYNLDEKRECLKELHNLFLYKIF